MKKIFTAAIAFVLCTAAFAKGDTLSHEDALNHFRNEYPNALNVSWHKFDNYYEIFFRVGDVPCRLLLQADDGSFYRLTRYYDESKMEPELKEKISRYYKNKTIQGVIELQYKEGTVYQVNLANDKYYYIVIVDQNGNVELKNRFKKAS